MAEVAPASSGASVDVAALRVAHVQALRDAFFMIDTDNSGTISASEFGTLLRLQGEDISDEDAQSILNEIDVDGDTTNLTFDEFVEIMDDLKMEGANKFDLAAGFAKRAKEKSVFFQAKDPLFVRMQREMEKKNKKEENDAKNIGFASGGNARMQLASIVDGNSTQLVVMVLILLDVICVMMELLLLATKCPCKVVYDDDETARASLHHHYGAYSSYGSSYGDTTSYSSYSSSSSYSSYSAYSSGDDSGSRRLKIVDMMEEYLGMGDPEDWGDPTYDMHRRLSGGSATIGGKLRTCVKNVDGDRNHYYSGLWWSDEQHAYEIALHWTSVSILFVFAAQIFALMLLYGIEFWKNVPYVADAIVVGGALYVELEPSGMFHGGSLFVILLSWRFLRVLHGLASSMELQAHRQHAKIKDERGNMLEMIVATRRRGAEKKLFFLEYQEKLLALGVQPFSKDDGEEGKESGGQDGEVHSAKGSALETAMALRKGDIDHAELKKRLDAEKERNATAESMYVEIYEHYAGHMDTLKDHTDKLGVSHGSHEVGGEGATAHLIHQETKRAMGRQTSAQVQVKEKH